MQKSIGMLTVSTILIICTINLMYNPTLKSSEAVSSSFLFHHSHRDHHHHHHHHTDDRLLSYAKHAAIPTAPLLNTSQSNQTSIPTAPLLNTSQSNQTSIPTAPLLNTSQSNQTSIPTAPLLNTSQSNQTSIHNHLKTSKVVLITFGDGYQSQFTFGKPVLDKYGFKGNFFVTCNRVGQSDKLTWPQLVQLYKEGNIIGSKTMSYGTHAMENKDLNQLSAKDLEYEVGQSKQCLLNHGIHTTLFAVPKNIASDNATVVNAIAKHYDMAINGHANLMFLHCDQWKHDSNQTDCRTFSKDGKLTFANKYSIREWSMQHTAHGHSYSSSQMFNRFVDELDSQNKYNKNGTITAIPIIGYHDIVPISDARDTDEPSARYS